jgi:phosphoenolpyruvate-protein kinase (PTS system EI component)
MIEVPSAAIMSDVFAREVDFFSIGTNDLTQYIMATDRSSSEISHLYDFFHPSLFRFIKIIISAAKKHKKEVSICGEMAADSRFVKVLIGMGIENFSVALHHIPNIKYIVSKTDRNIAKEIAKKTLSFSDVVDLKRYIELEHQNI